MARGTRVAVAVVGVVLALGLAGCSDDSGGSGDSTDPEVTRDQTVEILLQQNYSRDTAECIIDNSKLQDVDLTGVFNRDQITEREAGVLAVVSEFCVEKFGSTGTTLVPPPPDG